MLTCAWQGGQGRDYRPSPKPAVPPMCCPRLAELQLPLLCMLQVLLLGWISFIVFFLPRRELAARLGACHEGGTPAPADIKQSRTLREATQPPNWLH